MSDFRAFEEASMRTLAQGRVILDVGGGSRFMKGMKKFEPLFVNCDYKTMDVSADYHPDIVGDIHAIPLADASVDGVICRSVLEHVERPYDAAREMIRILKPGGYAFVQVPSIYPYHARTGHGAYPDHWRYFESGLRLLFKDCSSVEIVKHGGWFRAMSFFLPAQARLRFILDLLADFFDRLFSTGRRTTTSFYSVLARK